MYRKIVFAVLIIVFTFQIAACGTIIYPKRRGQTAGRIDPAIAILDGVGVLLFVIPGLVAFAIDFASGAIYLPEGKAEKTLTRVVRVAPSDLTKGKIEDILSEHTGQLIRLDKALQAYQLDGAENLKEISLRHQ